MKKVLHIFLLIAVLSLVAMAQSDFDEPKWTKLDNPLEEFTINFPTPKINGFAKSSAAGSGQYVGVLNKTYFAAFSSNSAERSIMEQLKGLAAAADTVPKDIEIDGFKGKRYDFRGTDDYEHSIIAIQAKVNFYIFHVISETRDNPLAEEFLGSIHLEDRPAVSDPEMKIGSPAAKTGIDSILKKSADGGARPGMGDNAPATFDVVAPPKYTKVDSQVAITFKTNPDYTELARKYLISGTVRLRVTFEKDRQIGDITVLSKLPLGLTQSAIRAARQIQFSPALRQGEPYTTTKPVEFNFKIY